jgi:hypothetical protein
MTLSLNKAWFADRSPGRGLITTATNLAPAAPLTRGKFYFEVQFTLAGGLSSLLVGVAGATFSLTDSIDVAVNGTNVTQAQCAVLSGAAVGGTCSGWGYPNRFSGTPNISFANFGDWFGVAVDTINGLLWMRNATAAATSWTGDGTGGTPNPATAVKGFDISTQITGNIYITAGTNKNWFDGDTTHSTVTLNAGHTAFAATPPAGFSPWDTTATTVFNSADKDSRITLSGANLIADTNMPSPFSTPPFSHNAMVRSNTSRSR